MDLIRPSNVVYNVIGNFKSTNHFSRRLTNVSGPFGEVGVKRRRHQTHSSSPFELWKPRGLIFKIFFWNYFGEIFFWNFYIVYFSQIFPRNETFLRLRKNNELSQLQKHSGILREQAEAIERIRNVYPDAIIVKSATAVGWRDRFTHWWCTNGKIFWNFFPQISN